MSATDLQAFLSQPVDIGEYEEVTLALLDDREGGEPEMPRQTHGKGVRAIPQPQPIKRPKKAK
jgi:hypothetical protein